MSTSKRKKVLIISGEEDDKGLIEHFIVTIDDRLSKQEEKQSKFEISINEKMHKYDLRLTTLEARIAIYIAVSVAVVAMVWQLVVRLFK